MRKIARYFVYGIVFILVCLSFVWFGLKTLLDQSGIKSLVKEKIQIYLKLDVEYTEIGTILFPLPGIQIKGLEIKDELNQICKIEEILVSLDILALLKKEFKIKSVRLENGNLILTRLQNGNLLIKEKFKSDSKEFEKKQEKFDDGPKALFSLFPKELEINNLNIVYLDLNLNINYEFRIEKMDILFDKEKLSTRIILFGEFDKNAVRLDAVISWDQDTWSKESIRMKANLDFDHLKLNNLRELTSIFPSADFSNSDLSLGLALEKSTDEMLNFDVSRLSLVNLQSNSGTQILDTLVTAKGKLQLTSGKAEIENIIFQSGELTEFQTKGSIEILDNRSIILDCKSERLDLKSLLVLINSFSHVNVDKSPLFAKTDKGKHTDKQNEKQKSLVVSLILDLKNLNLDGKQLSYLKGPVELKEEKVSFRNLQVGIFGGKIINKGMFNLRKYELHIDSEFSNINVERALSVVTIDQLITGKLGGNASIDLNLQNTANLLGKIRLLSKFNIKKGRLLGYANFIKPVAEVGKLLNFNGPKGESNAFESIQGIVFIKNHNIYLKSFEMKGVGLNASGSGFYSESGKIDMKFTVSLSGFIGKAVKLPIIYKGFYGKNFAYIDPVWLASVYAGTIFLGGPAGVILGGMVGSGASDTVDHTVKSVEETVGGFKNFLFGEKKKAK